MSGDVDMLECQKRNLARENRELRRNLRDQFAMAALSGYLASYAPLDDPLSYTKAIATDCWAIADAMLAARQS